MTGTSHNGPTIYPTEAAAIEAAGRLWPGLPVLRVIPSECRNGRPAVHSREGGVWRRLSRQGRFSRTLHGYVSMYRSQAGGWRLLMLPGVPLTGKAA